MKIIISSAALLVGTLVFAQAKNDTIKQKENQIEGVTLTARKPTVESKVDRTVFNVSNSSILAGNTTWDVLRMTPLISIDNNDAVKAEGESVTVYINDRKSVFTGKELKEYLKTIPADNLMKIEVITSPSSRYETTGSVINIVLKKRDDEGMKGSATFNNRQNTKNSQYTNLNLNYHKKSFTQTLIGSYSDNTYVQKNVSTNSLYKDNDVTNVSNETMGKGKSPSLSSTSEYELNDKNNIGLILEYYQSKNTSTSDADLYRTKNNNEFFDSYHQDQDVTGLYRTLGTNLFYKYYDKEKNKILDINLGSNYNSQKGTDSFLKTYGNSSAPDYLNINSHNQTRNYYIKVDYTQPIGKGTFEVGGKMDFNNNVIPNSISGNKLSGLSTNDVFHYEDNINSLYANYSKTFFEKLETRIGVRYEHIDYKMRQDVAGTERKDSYGTLLPNLLLKYSFSDKYDLSLTYNRNLWRPWYAEFNPFLVPTNEGTFSRGNMDLEPNPSHRLYMKLGIMKKYFLSARYMYTDRDYWTSFADEGGKTVTLPANFNGKVQKYYLFANTNQTFLKNKMNVNVGVGWYYIDNHDFNQVNDLKGKDYISYVGASANLSYTNLFNKNINLSAWVELSNQNNGNSYANKTNIFHNISATKIFPKTQMEVSLQLMNIFSRPNFDNTTYSQDGTFRSALRSDWYGFSLSFVKRFGNQKVKDNTKTDVEKNSGGGK
ncbi:outer membrane receptor protein involved in Fe transport [Chryseobacterium sp. 52]|uniref:outer membrane beta-barrel protein n=1 Tax=Chryseobacterium sp. 52 TaxID=2035213 RepID=UPI000C18372A|nr:outer membrane beta-barrel protein [Chryseobacterium sp. 52]PIF44345.1 outer membrane receptor protein involved in Fe transport [Chryseobacterium sp. 52]